MRLLQDLQVPLLFPLVLPLVVRLVLFPSLPDPAIPRQATLYWRQVRPWQQTALVAALLLLVVMVVQVVRWSFVLARALAARLATSRLLPGRLVAVLPAVTWCCLLVTRTQAQVAQFAWSQAVARVLQVAMCHSTVAAALPRAVLLPSHQLM